MRRFERDYRQELKSMTKMSVSASGLGGNPGKLMFGMGMLFVVLGAITGSGWIVVAFASSMPMMALGGVLFLAIFCGIGGFFAKIGHDSMHANDEVLREGAAYLGKIFALEPDYQIMMNGQPCITLVVRYLMSGQIREARVNTGEVDQSRYPRGATVSIRVHEGVAALVPGSVSDMRIEQEDDLMNPDFDASGSMSSIGVSCPNCGANIAVPVGMARFCPYCDSKVSVTEDGRVIG